MKSIFVLLSITMLIIGCASRDAGWESSASKISLSKKEIQSLEKNAKAAWKNRHQKKDLMESIELYEKLASATEGRDFYNYSSILARAYYLMADAHESDVDEKKKNWNIGTSWAERAMAVNEDFRKSVASGEDVTDALKFLDKSYIDAIYWSAANLGKWAKNSGIATTLKYKNRIRTMVGKVLEWDEKFFYAAPLRYFGAYYAVAPGFAGGDMKKSKQSFDRSIKLAPNYLGTYVLYAELYDVKESNKDAFISKLNKVIKTKANIDPELMPENVIEQKKAKALLAKVNELF